MMMGQPFPRKILPGSDNVPTRQGLFDWTHAAPVGPPFWNQAKKVQDIYWYSHGFFPAVFKRA
jgi:hypothetical protein